MRSIREAGKSTEGGNWKLWKGVDVATVYNSVVFPQRTSKHTLLFTPDALPPYIDDFRDLSVSVRSRLSQHAIDVDEEGLLSQLAQALKTEQAPFPLTVDLTNYGTRPIRLPEGTKFLRLFTDSERHAITGGALQQLVFSKDIQIDGEAGVDWIWKSDEEDASGIYVRIMPDSLVWIPPDYKNSTPITVDTENGSRDKINLLLEPAPIRTQTFWIGETRNVALGVNVEGIIGKPVRIEEDGTVRSSGRHLNSRLIDGGTDWRVRVEVVSSTLADQVPNYVSFYFVSR